LTLRYGLKGLTIATFVLSTVAVTAFGFTAPELDQLSAICFVA
jgi:hypothetical protein